MAKHLESLQIKNFRMLEDFTVGKLGDVNLIVGKNNSGKSTVLEALLVYATEASSGVLDMLSEMRNEKGSSISKVDSNSYSGFFYGRKFSDFNFLEVGNTKNLVKIFAGDASGENGANFMKTHSDLVELDKLFFKKYNRSFFWVYRNSEWKNSVNLNFGDDDFTYSHGDGNDSRLPTGYVSVAEIEGYSLDDLWDKIIIDQREEDVIEVLDILIPQLKGVFFVNAFDKDKRIPFVGVAGQEKRVPLKSYGYGAQRAFDIAVKAVRAKDGFLLIDEFENGLHYSVQEKVWQMIFEMAKKLNIQVFATTHSWDCIEAFAQVAKEREDVEGVLFRMGRSIRNDNKGQIIATVFNEDDLVQLTKADVELR